MSRRETVAELLHALADVMADRGIRWYLFGAQAAIIWGSPRLSADADVTAVIDPEAMPPFVEAMRRRGFDLRIDDADFLARTRVLPFLHRRTRMPLDLVLAGPGLEEEFLRRAVPVDVAGRPVPVISPEDLIVTKILAGRPKDIEDVRGVIQERRVTLRAERIRDLLSLLERALGQSDLLPVFQREWGDEQPRKSTRKVRDSRSGPKKK